MDPCILWIYCVSGSCIGRHCFFRQKTAYEMRISDWSSDVCSSDLRMTGMLNVPIVADQLGLRVAGSMTDRDGYDYNSVTQNRVNGRDLWSLRTTLGFENDLVRGSFIWGRFREDDNRSRTGKQL